MSSQSAIEWTDATWNPTRGCRKISPGCKHCYAETFAERFQGVKGHAYELGFTPRTAPSQLLLPLTWRKSRKIFVDSMSDLFLEDFPFEYIAAVFGVMAACPQHTFQVLTKRPERAVHFFQWLDDRCATEPFDVSWDRRPLRCWQFAQDAWTALAGSTWSAAIYEVAHRVLWPLRNVWIGTSVEDQQRADDRVPHLLKVSAAVRFLSCEPLLGLPDLRRVGKLGRGPDIDALTGHVTRYGYKAASDHECSLDVVTTLDLPRIDWVIAGGESGPGARPMHPDWARALRDQCVAARVPFFFKQWGAWSEMEYDHESPPGDRPGERYLNVAGGHGFHGEQVIRIRRRHKTTNGRLLDGREWNDFPEAPR